MQEGNDVVLGDPALPPPFPLPLPPRGLSFTPTQVAEDIMLMLNVLRGVATLLPAAGQARLASIINMVSLMANQNWFIQLLVDILNHGSLIGQPGPIELQKLIIKHLSPSC